MRDNFYASGTADTSTVRGNDLRENIRVHCGIMMSHYLAWFAREQTPELVGLHTKTFQRQSECS